MVTSLLLSLIVVGATVSGQVCLKAGMNQIGRGGLAQIGSSPLLVVRAMMLNPYIMGAVPLYAASFVLWAFVLSRLKLSIAYPILALNYVLVPLASSMVFKETISIQQLLGMLLICIGVLLATRGIIQ